MAQSGSVRAKKHRIKASVKLGEHACPVRIFDRGREHRLKVRVSSLVAVHSRSDRRRLENVPGLFPDPIAAGSERGKWHGDVRANVSEPSNVPIGGVVEHRLKNGTGWGWIKPQKHNSKTAKQNTQCGQFSSECSSSRVWGLAPRERRQIAGEEPLTREPVAMARIWQSCASTNKKG
jgi:hypothetical protein